MGQLELEKLKRSHCNAHDSEILDPQSDFKQIKVHTQMQMHVMQTNANTCYANKCKCILCKQIQKQILKKKIQPTPQISVLQIAFLVDHLASVFCSWPAQLGRFNIIICTNSICPVAQASRFSNLCCLLGMRFQLLFVSFIPPLKVLL